MLSIQRILGEEFLDTLPEVDAVLGLQPAVALAVVNDILRLAAAGAHGGAHARAVLDGDAPVRRRPNAIRNGIAISLARSTGAAALSSSASLIGSPTSIGVVILRSSLAVVVLPGRCSNSSRGSVTATTGDAAAVELGMADRAHQASHSHRSCRRRCRSASGRRGPCSRPSELRRRRRPASSFPSSSNPCGSGSKPKPRAAAELGLDDDVAARGEELGVGVPLPLGAAQPGAAVHEDHRRSRPSAFCAASSPRPADQDRRAP